MKKVLIASILLIVFAAIIAVSFLGKDKVFLEKANFTGEKTYENRAQETASIEPERSLFVPYWTLNHSFDQREYDTLIYFGISADSNGIDESDVGFQRINDFTTANNTHNKKTMLTLRMLDNDENTKVLKDKVTKSRIIEKTISIAQENEFDGIVLDLETKSLGFESATKRNTNFIVEFANAAKNVDLDFYTLLFGDTYYRVRAYDVKKITDASDRVMIMAYDFHKAGGNPGPNFPLTGKETYGYDFQTMIKDFTADAQNEKIVVVFGMFGYDWTTDDQGDSTSVAEAVTYNQAKNRMLNQCNLRECKVLKDKTSAETTVVYTDEEEYPHVVWFETEESMNEKRKHLEEKGINSVSFWANSFF